MLAIKQQENHITNIDIANMEILFIIGVPVLFAYMIIKGNLKQDKYKSRQCERCGKKLLPKNNGMHHYYGRIRVYFYKCSNCGHEFYKPIKSQNERNN